jgi:hypothetical protein
MAEQNKTMADPSESAAMSDVDNFRTRLLETYPVTEYELDYLTKFRDFYFDTDSTDFSFSAWLELSSARDTPHAELLKQIETTLLPSDFASILFETAMSKVITLGCNERDKELHTFLEAAMTCLGRRGPKAIIDLVSCCCLKEDACLWIYQLTLASHLLLEQETSEMEIVQKAPDSWTSDKQSFRDWANNVAPQAYTALSTFVHLALFTRDHAFRPSTPPLLLPKLDEKSAILCKSEAALDLASSIALMSPNLGGAWHRLYSTDDDGCSFYTMQHALIGYQGPTVILIRSTSGDVFGFSTDCPWKLSTKWFGEGSDSFLFAIHPKVALYPATGQGKHYMYLNLPPRHRPQDLKGMAMGGISSDTPRLLVTESFQDCRACSIGMTFASGPILSNDMQSYFDVDVLEIWATGQSLEVFRTNAKKGKLQVAVHEAARKNIAKVDAKEFVDDLASGAYMNKAFPHREHTLRCTVRDLKDYFDRPNESQHGLDK